ncbi:tetratricopeptide repeat protein [Nocardioides fonticola]|uniref:tetratricopeptide repeat protein n=1 Tax=Nocardioides fonticola TaxID=450363 RepID=UPI0031CF5166
MAEQRGQRPGGTGGRGGRATGGRDDRRQSSGGARGAAPRGQAAGRSRDDERRGRGGAGAAAGAPTGRGRSGERDQQRSGGRPPRDRDAAKREPRVDQAVYDGPPLPDEVTGRELDRAIAAQLKGLPEKLAARIARHLVAAGQLIDDDPETAYRHALAARARAPRLAVVREAAGEAAYAAGHYSEALAELRAAKRMNGATAYLPIMADCHRALGQPEQAIKLAKSPSVVGFTAEAKAEMTIVEAGARRDMGQFDAALRTLELAPLTSKSRAAWVVRLRYAYADTLEAAGREADALTWFHRTQAIDSEELTDAAERAAALEQKLGD